MYFSTSAPFFCAKNFRKLSTSKLTKKTDVLVPVVGTYISSFLGVTTMNNSDESEFSAIINEDNFQDRADELNELIRNPDIRCIMSTIGGRNSNALLPYIY